MVDEFDRAESALEELNKLVDNQCVKEQMDDDWIDQMLLHTGETE